MDLEVYLLTRGRDVPRHSHYLYDSRATIYKEEGCSEGQRYLAKLMKNWHIKFSLSYEHCHLEVKQHQITDLTFLKVHVEKFMIYTQDLQFHIFIQTIPPFQFHQKKAILHLTFIRTILIQNIRVYEIKYIQREVFSVLPVFGCSLISLVINSLCNWKVRRCINLYFNNTYLCKDKDPSCRFF